MVKVIDPNGIEPYLNLIEAQQKINDRFIRTKRIDQNGGDGCFSLVFTAYDEVTGQDVILKFYHPLKIDDHERLMRFQREGEILKRLRGQPNILECIDGVCTLPITLTHKGLSIQNNYFFIPTKKAKESLEHLIYSSPLSAQDYLIYFREMCKGVARLHSQKICHRDLKPSNVFLFSKNDIRIGDFGTAKFLDGSMPNLISKYIVPVGDTGYIAPELICQIGIADDYSYTSDLFSLAAILFEMFTKENLTYYLYTPEVIGDLVMLSNVISRMSSLKDRLEVYTKTINDIDSVVNKPDIFSFNQSVPGSIKYQLNSLFKEMSQFNFIKRLKDFSTIYRRINICILILRNEEKYQNQLRQKRLFRLSK